ncbi:uncharacterized protein METZ01_LOCUS375645, partial [marine metagenome]
MGPRLSGLLLIARLANTLSILNPV